MIRGAGLAALALLCAGPALAQATVSGLFAPATQSDIATVQGQIPTVATTTPTCIADTASIGTAMNQFAPANHTHCSKIRKQRVTGVATSSYAWTYPTAFPAGVVPVCQALVEDPSASTSDSYNVQVSGVPTNTQATFRIIRQSTGLLALLTGALSINPTPGNINLHLSCFEP